MLHKTLASIGTLCTVCCFIEMKSINIIVVSADHPCIEITGNGTYDLRSTFLELGLKWDSQNKSWIKPFDVTRMKELQNIQLQQTIINQITKSAETKGINITNGTEQNFTFASIRKAAKSINRKNHKWGKLIKRDKPKNIKKRKKGINKGRGRSNKKDYIESKVSYGRIELYGNTYKHREWLKDTFDAKFDGDNKCWWIDITKYSLTDVDLLLEDYGVLKGGYNDRNQSRSRSRSRDRNRNKNKRDILLSDNESQQSDIIIITDDDDYVESDYGVNQDFNTILADHLLLSSTDDGINSDGIPIEQLNKDYEIDDDETNYILNTVQCREELINIEKKSKKKKKNKQKLKACDSGNNDEFPQTPEPQIRDCKL